MGKNQHNMNRRQFLGRALLTGTALAGGASLLSGCGAQGGASSTRAMRQGGTSSGGKGGPIRIGFIPLTDCASVVMAHELGLYKKARCGCAGHQTEELARHARQPAER
jgi:ABC-type nitrate/sulfonate/bicarbonate transport system substrate-binding protein